MFFFFFLLRCVGWPQHHIQLAGCLSSVHVDFFFLLFSSLFGFLLIDHILAATRRTGIPLMGHHTKVSYFKLIFFYFENLYGPRQQRTQRFSSDVLSKPVEF